MTAIGTANGRMTAGDWRSSTESRQLSDQAGDQLTNLTMPPDEARSMCRLSRLTAG